MTFFFYLDLKVINLFVEFESTNICYAQDISYGSSLQKKRKMKKIHFDLLMILLTLVLLLTLNRLDLLEEYAKFGMVPLLAFYWLGQYAERKFKRK